MERPFVVATISLLLKSDLHGRAKKKKVNGFANKIFNAETKPAYFFLRPNNFPAVWSLTKLKSHSSSATYSISIVTEICSKLPRRTLDSTERTSERNFLLYETFHKVSWNYHRFVFHMPSGVAEHKQSHAKFKMHDGGHDSIRLFFLLFSILAFCAVPGWYASASIHYGLCNTMRILGLHADGVNIFFARFPSISHSLESGPLLLLSDTCVCVCVRVSEWWLGSARRYIPCRVAKKCIFIII